jgi:hypothetical protein
VTFTLRSRIGRARRTDRIPWPHPGRAIGRVVDRAHRKIAAFLRRVCGISAACLRRARARRRMIEARPPLPAIRPLTCYFSRSPDRI